MHNYLIYCDISTMKCTAEGIDQQLEKHTQGYVRVNDSLWLTKLPEEYLGTMLRKEEFLLDIVLGDCVAADSFIIIAPLDQNAHWNLPDELHSFLSSDPDN